jgi:hypothetical protein
MAYANEAHYRYKDIPVLPTHLCGEALLGKKLLGAHHVFGWCAYCGAMWILLADETWETVTFDRHWGGKSATGE